MVLGIDSVVEKSEYAAKEEKKQDGADEAAAANGGDDDGIGVVFGHIYIGYKYRIADIGWLKILLTIWGFNHTIRVFGRLNFCKGVVKHAA